jgi:protein-S-isoprenylcysteine O-methyltransferase Ste14
MNGTTDLPGQTGTSPNTYFTLPQIVLRAGIGTLVQAALLFATAGRLDWGLAWAYLAVYFCCSIYSLRSTDTELAAERTRVKANVKTWDKVLTTVLAPLIFALPVVIGLDQRNGWSPEMPLWLALVGLGLVALSWLLIDWAVRVNRFFARFVRIQHDRGQVVISDGPYRFVRHPGYVGTLLQVLAIPLALGSLWGLVPAGLAALLVLLRTALEDRMLQAELPGYREYATRVHYRLIPGVW